MNEERPLWALPRILHEHDLLDLYPRLHDSIKNKVIEYSPITDPEKLKSHNVAEFTREKFNTESFRNRSLVFKVEYISIILNVTSENQECFKEWDKNILTLQHHILI